jgi:hypothetical protein
VRPEKAEKMEEAGKAEKAGTAGKAEKPKSREYIIDH